MLVKDLFSRKRDLIRLQIFETRRGVDKPKRLHRFVSPQGLEDAGLMVADLPLLHQERPLPVLAVARRS